MKKRFVNRIMCVTMVAAMLAPSLLVEAKADTVELISEVNEEDILISDDSITDDSQQITLSEDDILQTQENFDTRDTEDIYMNTDLLEEASQDKTSTGNALGYVDSGLSVNVSKGSEINISEEIPETYDLRREGRVTPVRNQNPYGTCWAFASLASMESNMLTNKYADSTINLSERHLAWFANNTGMSRESAIASPIDITDGDYACYDEKNGQSTGCYDAGGNAEMSVMTMSRWQGGAKESDYPYSNIEGMEGIKLTTGDAYSSVAHLQNAYFINCSQRDEIKKAIMTYGACEVEYFHNDGYYNSSTGAYFSDHSTSINHAVTIVGWDDNYSVDNFNSTLKPSKSGAWLIKNSWGTDWGNDGYMWISYFEPSIDHVIVYLAEEADNYDHNYFYTGSIEFLVEKARKMSNVYEAKGDEVLRAVGIMMYSTDSEYTVSVYTGVSGADPTNGTLQSTTSGTTSYEGFYTIPLSIPVELKEGEKFSIVFSFNDDTMVFCEQADEDWGLRSSHTYSKAGQSYIYNDSWEDISVEDLKENLRIHAYTDDAGDETLTPTAVTFKNIKEGTVSVNVNRSVKINTSVTPKNANKHLKWSSSNSQVASVDQYGNVVGVAEGTAVIRAESELDSEVYAECSVTVRFVLNDLNIFGNSKIIYGTNSAEYYVKQDPEQYILLDSPEWSSSNPQVFTVEASKDGMSASVIPQHAGEAYLTVSADGLSKKKLIEVDVSDVDMNTLTSKYSYNGVATYEWDAVLGAKYYAVWDQTGEIIAKIDETGKSRYSYEYTALKGKTTEYNNADGFEYYKDYLDFSVYEDYYNISGETTEKEIFISNREPIYPEIFNVREKSVKYLDINKNEILSANYIFGNGDVFITPKVQDGYEFVGWNTKPDYSGDIYYPGDSVDDNLSSEAISYTKTGSNKWEKDTEYFNLYGMWQELKVSNPTFLSQTNVIKNNGKVRISCGTEGALIYYTLDGSTPVKDNPGTFRYTDSIVLENNDIDAKDITINAYAVKSDYKDSDVSSMTYTVLSDAKDWGDIDEEVRLSSDFPYSKPSEVPAGVWAYGIRDCEYNGEAVTFPEMKVYYHKTLLQPGKDYTVKYSNNVKAALSTAKKAPTVSIAGKGNYSKTTAYKFNIIPMELTDDRIEVENITTIYNRKKQLPIPNVVAHLDEKSVKLKSGKDFTLEYIGDFVEAGEYTLKVNGKSGGNYTGSISVNVSIKPEGVMAEKLSVTKIPKQKYTGEYLTLKGSGNDKLTLKKEFLVKSGKTVLKEGEHYTISYENNCLPGKGSIIITGTGNMYDNIVVYGRKVIDFDITGTALKKVIFSGIPKSVVYNGREYNETCEEFKNITLKTKGTKTEGSKILNNGIDYRVSFLNNTKAGTATMLFEGMAGYTGTVKKTFKINPADIEGISDQISFNLSNIQQPYVKGGVKPCGDEVVIKDLRNSNILVENVDYVLSYSNNKAVNDCSSGKKLPTVIVKGKGNYKGTNKSLTFAITKKVVNDKNVTVNASDVVYKNSKGNYKCKITVLDSDGSKLTAGKDYDKTYEYRYAYTTTVTCKEGKTQSSVTRAAYSIVNSQDIIPAGTRIIVAIKFKGAYEGTVKTSFRVVDIDLSKAKVTLKNTLEYSPENDQVELRKQDLEVVVKGKTLDDTDYEIIGYSNNSKAGKASVTIQGVGNYGGTYTYKFKIKGKTF